MTDYNDPSWLDEAELENVIHIGRAFVDAAGPNGTGTGTF